VLFFVIVLVIDLMRRREDYDHEHEHEGKKRNSIFHTLSGEGSCEMTDRERIKSI
jgi:hypothetical protein